MCQINNNTNSRKGKHLDYRERQSIERWWNRDRKAKTNKPRIIINGTKIRQ